MKKILTILLMTSSHLLFAQSPYVGIGSAQSTFRDFSGCEMAKELAISDAEAKCYQSGHTSCRLINVKKIFSKEMAINQGNLPIIPVYVSAAQCQFKAFVQGIN